MSGSTSRMKDSLYAPIALLLEFWVGTPVSIYQGVEMNGMLPGFISPQNF